MKILESYLGIAESLFIEAEIDDEEMIKYKDKDGESKEMKAGSAKTMDKEHPAKIEYDRMADKGGEEEPKGKGLGKGDFERDFDDGEPEDKPHGGDTGADADFQGEPPEGAKEPEDGGDEPEVDGPSPEDDWDTGQVMTAKLDGEEVGDIIGDEDHPSYKKALKYIMSFDPDDEKLIQGPGGDHGGWKPKDETVTINGKQYRPVKESKQRTFKEIYDRTFRSLK